MPVAARLKRAMHGSRKVMTASPARTLSEQAYQMIKQRLVSAHYEPGQFLQENVICKELKLGRTPVHQALHQLQQEGLLEIIPRKGIFIKVDSPSEVFTALEVRTLIEPHCAAQCAERAKAADIDYLKSILGQYEKLGASADHVRLMELDRAFHTAIAEIAGNRLIKDILRPIHERMSRIWFMPHWQFHDFDLTSNEHGRIVAAVEMRDPTAAASNMREHIESLRRRILAVGPAA